MSFFACSKSKEGKRNGKAGSGRRRKIGIDFTDTSRVSGDKRLLPESTRVTATGGQLRCADSSQHYLRHDEGQNSIPHA
jgi:hypothetical protein